MQSIGFPTYCLVVTITENVNRITDEMHLKIFSMKIDFKYFKTLPVESEDWAVYMYVGDFD